MAYSKRLKIFKELTVNHPVIMGRVTFESITKILGHPLRNRTNIVISRGLDCPKDNSFLVARSIEDAIELASKLDDNIFIIGGAKIYSLASNHIDRIYVSFVECFTPDADIFFPDILDDFPKVIESKRIEEDKIAYTRVCLERDEKL